MATDITLLGVLLALALVGFVTGVLRYDVVALLTLLAATLLGVVPTEEAFSGLGHPAVVTVAAVLVISRAFFRSGLVEALSQIVLRAGKHPTLQALALTGTVAVLSAFVNNVGALALMLPVGLKLAQIHKFPPSRLLMPLSFGSLLGGLTTMIGTPPNIIVANYRDAISGEPFGLFDFTPVGAGVALAGVLFISLVGWRLLPDREGQSSPADRFEIESYLGELRVEEKSKVRGMALREMLAEIDGAPPVLAVIRNEKAVPAHRFQGLLEPGDILLAEGETDEIKTLANKAGLAAGYASTDKQEAKKDDEADQPAVKAADLSLAEAVVMAESRLVGRTAAELRLLDHYNLNLIAVARRGRRLKGRPRDVRFKNGDVLLLEGPAGDLDDQLTDLGCLPLADRGLELGKPRRMVLSIVLFAVAVTVILLGWVPAPIALMSAAVLMVVTGVLDLRNAYAGIDWPVLVLLASMIPVGQAFETSGGADLLANQLLALGDAWPPVAMLGVLLVVTMFLSDLINNAAAVVLMAPIGQSLARGLELSAEAFLMAVAIGASCAFLTPIGHQSNTLVFGPGGYRFGDYWKLGLPVQIVIFVVAIPLLLWVWPLTEV